MRIESWPKSEAAWQRAKRSLPGGVSTALRASAKPHPIYFQGGSGATLTDIDGNSYLDYVLGWGPNILGHGNPRLVSAVQDQITRGATYGSSHHLEYEVAESLLNRFPGMERVLWSNTGTEANLAALRIVRAATDREGFVKFDGHYHGWSDPMLVGYRGAGGPESKGQLADSADRAHVLPWGDLDAARSFLANRSDIAAVFLEPVLCNSGVIEPPAGFLEGIRKLCDEHGIILIFDEVITGLRLWHGGASQKYGVTPDMTILAKAVAGGLSLSVVLGKAELLDLTLKGVTHAGTYNGNPLVLAAAAATLTELTPEKYQQLDTRGSRLAASMRDSLRRASIVGAVNHAGGVIQCSIGIEQIRTVQEFSQADQSRYDQLLLELLRRGIFAVPGGRWYLSTAHDDEIIDRTAALFDDSLESIK